MLSVGGGEMTLGTCGGGNGRGKGARGGGERTRGGGENTRWGEGLTGVGEVGREFIASQRVRQPLRPETRNLRQMAVARRHCGGPA